MAKINQRVLLELEACERLYATGKEPDALLHAIYVCTSFKIPLPDWLVQAFRDAYRKGLRGELKSWDDAFGHPRTRTQRLRQERDFVAPRKVWDRITEAKANGETIDDALFERVGRELGIGGKSMVKDYYRLWQDIEDPPPTPKTDT